MRAYSILLLLITLMFLTSIVGQTPQKSTRPKPKIKKERKLLETGRTQDGREVRLYDDMSFEVTASTVPAPPAMITLHIKAGVITKGGELRAVPKTDFMVFKQDIKPILTTITDPDEKPLEVLSFYLADRFRELDEGRTYNSALEKLKPVIVRTFTTDIEGSSTVQIPSSSTSYWIYGSSEGVGASACMWYLQIVPSKHASVVLDNNNAVYCG